MNTPIFDMNRTFDENLHEGPFFNESIPERIIPNKREWVTLFGLDVSTPIGVSACPFVANARGMKLAADLGYNLITWKTIRSKPAIPHPAPNFTFVRYKPIDTLEESFEAVSAPLDEPIACANSIGNASYCLDETLQAMEKGRVFLKEGQLFITSLYGVGETHAALINDFVFLAKSVESIGAQIVELNLSCPNVNGLLYHDAAFVHDLGLAVSKAVAIPVIMKIGLFPNEPLMHQTLLALARSGVQGVAGINTVPFKIVTSNNAPFFGPTREWAGVSGAPIYPFTASWLKKVAEIKRKERLDLTILAGGGITMPNQIDGFFEAGADAVMMATGALINPFLAHEYHALKYNFSLQGAKERAL